MSPMLQFYSSLILIGTKLVYLTVESVSTDTNLAVVRNPSLHISFPLHIHYTRYKTYFKFISLVR